MAIQTSVTEYGMNTYQKRIDVDVSGALNRGHAEQAANKATGKHHKRLVKEGYEWGSVQLSPQGKGKWLATYTYTKDKV
jgi:hypothetical protein